MRNVHGGSNSTSGGRSLYFEHWLWKHILFGVKFSQLYISEYSPYLKQELIGDQGRSRKTKSTKSSLDFNLMTLAQIY